MTDPSARCTQYFDVDDNPTHDEAAYTRAVVTEGGSVRTVLNYLDAEGNPIPFAHAWRVSRTDYDADGNIVGHSPGITAVDGELYDPDDENGRV